MTPITFSLQARPTDAAEWVALCRRAEELGFDAIYAAHHVGSTASPFVTLAAAAAVTSRVRLGTYVINAGIAEPLQLAADVATLDVVSAGRAVLGLGAGHTPAEWTMLGRAQPAPRERVDRMIAVAEATRRLLLGHTVTADGLDHARLDQPRPVQDPVPLLIGGNGTRVLRYAARHADIVGLSGLGRTLPDGHSHEVAWRPNQVAERVELVRGAAAAAGCAPQLEALVQHVELTDDAEAAAQRLAADLRGTTAADLLAAPYTLFGTPETIAAELRGHAERLGITRYVVRADALDAAAAILGAAGS
jgi:probable F420-dependent oxidoreductase